MTQSLIRNPIGAKNAHLDVVERALRLGEVLLGGQDGVLRAAQALVALVQRVHHAAAAGDVLLQGGQRRSASVSMLATVRHLPADNATTGTILG